MKLVRVLTMMALVLVSGVASSAFASSMSCLVGVFTAQDIAEGASSSTKPQVVTLPLDADGSGRQVFQVNGEYVAMSISKFKHTDLYELTLKLFAPIAERGRGPAYIAMATEHLYNDGPATGSWDIIRGPDSVRFAYLNEYGNLVAPSARLEKAMKIAGFDESNIGDLEEFVRDQLQAKTLNQTDIVLLGGLFSCTLEK